MQLGACLLGGVLLAYCVSAATLPTLEPTLPHEGNETERARRNSALPDVPALTAQQIEPSDLKHYGYSEHKPTAGAKFRMNQGNKLEIDGEDEQDPDDDPGDTGTFVYEESDEIDTDEGVSEPDAEGPHAGRGQPRSMVEHSTRIISQQNVALVRWTEAEDTTSNKKFNTVGALIAINAIVTTPSVRVPVSKEDTSNWNVDSIRFPLNKKTVKGKDLVVVYHPKFTMNPDGPDRLALVMLTPGVQRATDTMMPIKMVASPFVPTRADFQEDEFSLANCVMVVNRPFTLEVMLVSMTATLCRYNTAAQKNFRNKICAVMQMRSNSPEELDQQTGYIKELGSPLFCGNVLAGVYAGVQNTRGSHHQETGDSLSTASLTKRLLKHDQMYTFTVPGAVPNYDFISGFVNEQTKEMRWAARINLLETNECDHETGVPILEHNEAVSQEPIEVTDETQPDEEEQAVTDSLESEPAESPKEEEKEK